MEQRADPRTLSQTGDDDLLTPPEVAEYLRLSVEGVRRLHRAGLLRAVRGRRLRFTGANVRAYIHGQ